APGDVRRGPGARREEQGHARDPADRARAGLGIGPARPVRPRLRRGQAGPRLPPGEGRRARLEDRDLRRAPAPRGQLAVGGRAVLPAHGRSEEHTSELQSLAYLVCRLLLEKKKTHTNKYLQTKTYKCDD